MPSSTPPPFVNLEVVSPEEMNELARCHWRDTTLVDIVSSTTETDLIGTAGTGIPIEANVLGIDRKLRITVLCDWLFNAGAGNTNGPVFKVYYGGTAVSSQRVVQNVNSTTRFSLVGIFYISAEGATNAQAVEGVILSALNAPVFTLPALNTSKGWTDLAIDSTVSQHLRVTATLDVNSASMELRKRDIIVEVV